MKNNLLLAVLMFFAVNIFAQDVEVGDISAIKTFPKVYNYDEEVTWYFDMAGLPFEETEDIYIWIWSPTEPDAGNWANSSDFAKLNYEGNFVWSFTLTPTEYFGVSGEDIANSAGFWLRLKNKDGSKFTGVANVSYTPFDSFYTADEVMRSYPSKPILNEPISILFNSNMVPGFEGAPSVHFHSGMNEWSVLQEYQAWLEDITAKTMLKDMGNGFYKMDIIPSQYYNDIPDGFILENITFLFVVKDWAGTSPEFILHAGEYIPPPPPTFTFFPLQISQKDIFGFIRNNNERGVNALKYEITAASKVLTGEFSGSTAEIKGFINLAGELQGIEGLESIKVIIKDNFDNLIIDTELPLKKLD